MTFHRLSFETWAYPIAMLRRVFSYGSVPVVPIRLMLERNDVIPLFSRRIRLLVAHVKRFSVLVNSVILFLNVSSSPNDSLIIVQLKAGHGVPSHIEVTKCDESTRSV